MRNSLFKKRLQILFAFCCDIFYGEFYLHVFFNLSSDIPFGILQVFRFVDDVLILLWKLFVCQRGELALAQVALYLGPFSPMWD